MSTADHEHVHEHVNGHGNVYADDLTTRPGVVVDVDVLVIGLHLVAATSGCVLSVYAANICE